MPNYRGLSLTRTSCKCSDALEKQHNKKSADTVAQKACVSPNRAACAKALTSSIVMLQAPSALRAPECGGHKKGRTVMQ
jgi:hypothetical protein